MPKWIKVPKPGQFRGEGKWYLAEEACDSAEQLKEIEESNFLPVVESDEKPED